MNVDHRTIAAEELERAVHCLDEARMLRGGGFPYGAVSRAYYAVFHAARALLFSLGLEVRSHRAVLNQVSERFVKPGRLQPEFARLLSHMQRDREDADYEPDAVFTAALADEAIADAEQFLAAARSLLA
jgi:hypothetical protein